MSPLCDLTCLCQLATGTKKARGAMLSSRISYLNGGEFVIEFVNPADPALRESVHVALVGAEPNVEPEGIDPLPGVTHYYIGSDPKAWLTNVKRSRKVRYRYLYPGIDLIFYGNGPKLEFDFEASQERMCLASC